MGPSPRIAGIASAIVLLVATSCVAQPYAEPAMIRGSYAQLDVLDDADVVGYAVEYWFEAEHKKQIVPGLGISAGDGGARFAYFDVRYGLWLTECVVLSPRAGIGAFRNSGSIDLGKTLEFRTGLDLEWCLSEGHRLGIGFFHLSNGGLSDENPGTEGLLVSFAWAIGRSGEPEP